jgi:Asp-tRNA(Asn)/Glu-tRNA(Gln) amidotransferase C subunit
MTAKQPRQISADEVRTLARIAGVEIAPERLEQLAQQVSTILQGLDQLDPHELHDIEPAAVFRLNWD